MCKKKLYFLLIMVLVFNGYFPLLTADKFSKSRMLKSNYSNKQLNPSGHQFNGKNQNIFSNNIQKPYFSIISRLGLAGCYYGVVNAYYKYKFNKYLKSGTKENRIVLHHSVVQTYNPVLCFDYNDTDLKNPINIINNVSIDPKHLEFLVFIRNVELKNKGATIKKLKLKRQDNEELFKNEEEKFKNYILQCYGYQNIKKYLKEKNYTDNIIQVIKFLKKVKLIDYNSDFKKYYFIKEMETNQEDFIHENKENQLLKPIDCIGFDENITFEQLKEKILTSVHDKNFDQNTYLDISHYNKNKEKRENFKKANIDINNLSTTIFAYDFNKWKNVTPEDHTKG